MVKIMNNLKCIMKIKKIIHDLKLLLHLVHKPAKPEPKRKIPNHKFTLWNIPFFSQYFCTIELLHRASQITNNDQLSKLQ